MGWAMRIHILAGLFLAVGSVAVQGQGLGDTVAFATGISPGEQTPAGGACATATTIYNTTHSANTGVEITSAANGPATCMGDKIVLAAGPRALCDIQIEVFNFDSAAPFQLTMELFTDCTTSGATGPCGSGTGVLIPGSTRTITVTPTVPVRTLFPVTFDYSGVDLTSEADNTITVKLNASRPDVFWRFNEVPVIGTLPPGEPATSFVERCGSIQANNGCSRAFGPPPGAPAPNNNFAIRIRGVVPPAAADLALTQSNNAAGNALLVGNTFQKTLTVTNNGPGAASAITVTDTLPAQLTFVSSNCGATAVGQVVTYTIPTLANGATNSCVLTVRIAAPGTIVNTAAITSSTPADPTPANNTTTAQIGPSGGGIAQTPVPALDRNTVLVLLGLVSALGLLALRQRQA